MGADSEATSDPSAASRRADLRLDETSGSYELVFSAVILGLFGFLIDRWLGTTPLLLILFTVAGLIGAAASLYYRYTYRIEQIQAQTAALRAAADEGGS